MCNSQKPLLRRGAIRESESEAMPLVLAYWRCRIGPTKCFCCRGDMHDNIQPLGSGHGVVCWPFSLERVGGGLSKTNAAERERLVCGAVMGPFGLGSICRNSRNILFTRLRSTWPYPFALNVSHHRQEYHRALFAEAGLSMAQRQPSQFRPQGICGPGWVQSRRLTRLLNTPAEQQKECR